MNEPDRAPILRPFLSVSRRRLVLAGLGALAVVGIADIGVAGTSVGAVRGPPAGLARISATRIAGGTAAQRSLLTAILTALAPTQVPQLRIVRVHDGVTLQAPVRMIWPEWEVATIGVAFFDRSADQHLPPVLEVDTGQLGWPTPGAGPRLPRATPVTVSAARRRMRRLALVSGARIEQLTVSAPDALAVAVRLRVGDAARFLSDRLGRLILRADATKAHYDGLYIEVDDSRGMAWADGETQLGGDSYVRPSLRGCNPFPPPGPTSPTSGSCHG